MNVFRTFLKNISPLTTSEADLLLESWDPVSCQKKEIITREGTYEKYIYFVLEGIQRAYYLKEDKEITIVFTYYPSFCGNIDSLLTRTPSLYFIEAITESSLLRRNYKEVEALAARYPGINTLLRKATEAALVGVNRKHYELLALTMEEKFESFYHRSAHLINQIPHKYIASYLGIDPTNFSKILKKYR